MKTRAQTYVTALATAALMVGCGNADGTDDPGSTTEAVTGDAGAVLATLLGSGDFASTSTTKGIVQTEIGHNSSIKLIAEGDMSYTSPYISNDPWANWAGQTFPVFGNHEFNSVAGSGGQQPYDMFNGKNAANNLTFPPITGLNGVSTHDFFYSYQVAPGWLLVVTNTNISNSNHTDCAIQSCSSQATRLKNAVDQWRTSHGGNGCVIVAMHTARFSGLFSGYSDNLPWAPTVDSIWKEAVAEQADIVLQAHAHVYEEFPRLDANGCTAMSGGTKLFTIGAGGRGQVTPTTSNLTCTKTIASHPSTVNGVLKLALYANSYGFNFETSATTGEPAPKITCNR